MKRMITAILAVFTALCLAVPACAAGTDSSTANAYRQFISSGTYGRYLHAPQREFEEYLQERDAKWDRFCLHDMNGDGKPELIIYIEYIGFEQADVFSCSGGSVNWLGTMGGDNFFQFIAYYDNAAYPGLFTFMGGIAMKIDQYTLEGGRLKKRAIGQTIVDYEGEETIGVDMKVSDSALRDILLNTSTGNHDPSRKLDWYSRSELQSDSQWKAFFNSATSTR